MARSIEEVSREVNELGEMKDVCSDILGDGMGAIAIYLRMKKRGYDVEVIEETMRSIGLGSFIPNV